MLTSSRPGVSIRGMVQTQVSFVHSHAKDDRVVSRIFVYFRFPDHCSGAVAVDALFDKLCCMRHTVGKLEQMTSLQSILANTSREEAKIESTHTVRVAQGNQRSLLNERVSVYFRGKQAPGYGKSF